MNAAKRYADELQGTAEAYHTRAIDHDVFHTRQTATWSEIALAGLDDDVLALLRATRS